MCLAVPMKVEEVGGGRARCTAFGEERWADLSLMMGELPNVGDYIIIQHAFAQRVVPEAEALHAYELFGEILDALE